MKGEYSEEEEGDDEGVRTCNDGIENEGDGENGGDERLEAASVEESVGVECEFDVACDPLRYW